MERGIIEFPHTDKKREDRPKMFFNVRIVKRLVDFGHERVLIVPESGTGEMVVAAGRVRKIVEGQE